MTVAMLETALENPVDGLALAGRLWENRDASPRAVVSLVHGLGEHSGRYDHLARFLAAQGIAVNAVDLRGHGRTQGARGLVRDFTALMGDLTALIADTRARFEDVPHILMGHSMGGGLVLRYGLDFPHVPLAGVIAQAPLIAVPEPVPAALQILVRFVSTAYGGFRLKAGLSGEKISTLPEEQRAYMDDPLNHGYLGGRLALGLFSNGDVLASARAPYPYPLLMTHGTDDVLTSFEASALAAKNLGARFISYPGSAHEVHNDLHRDRVYDDLAGFILRRAEGKRA